MQPPPDARARLEALVAGGQMAAAAELADAMAPGMSDQDWFVRIRMTLAQAAGDPDTLLSLAARLRVLCPDNPAAYFMACAVLRQRGLLDEAEALARAGMKAAPAGTPILIEAASIASAAGHNDLAFARWAEVRARAPEAPIGFNGPLALAMRLRESELAASLIAEGLAVFPRDRTLLMAAAQEAARHCRWQQSESCWSTLFSLHPHDCGLVLEAVRSLQGGRADRAARRPAMLRMLREAQTRMPGQAPLFARELDVLREGGALDEAAALGRGYLSRFPTHPGLAVLCADIESERRQPESALRLLEEARPRCQPDAAFEAACVRLLCLVGRTQEAEDVCARAIARLGGEAKLVEQHIAMAARRGDFDEAARRLTHWRAAFPLDRDIQAVTRRLEMLADGTAPQAGASGPDQGGMARLFGRFESLGADSFGCEFGMVQRSFGAEPIGLLRWANIPMEGLARAIDARFEGFGAPEHTAIEVKLAEAGEREYFITDARFGYFAHTFIRTSEAPRDRIALQSQRRLRFLAAKLAEDVEAGEKIFVYKSHEPVEPALLEHLFGVLRARGRSQGRAGLLCIERRDAASAGGVRVLRPGLFLAAVRGLPGEAAPPARGINIAAWRMICAEVARRQDAAAPTLV